MKIIFSKKDFPIAPGGNIYSWKEADTVFTAPQDGKYLIIITASAKSAHQNKSKDDDDLRVSIDDYEFGKYETHDEMVSWKGFGTAASWDGAVLRGGEKTIYFFVEILEGEHRLKFYADETPTLKEINIFRLEDGEPIEFKEMKPPQNIKVDKMGVAWLGFVFLGVKPKYFSIAAITESASQKKTTDGDNLKVVVNGKILPNQKAVTSNKYKNFYFSGDLDQGKGVTLEIAPKSFEFLEDSVELWYDENPNVTVKIEVFDSVKKWLDESLPEKGKIKFYESILRLVIRSFYFKGYKYSGQFLEHAFSKHPGKLFFDNDSALANAIKKDSTYKKMLAMIQAEIKNDIQEGQIYCGNREKGLEVAFITDDLKYALHGLKKIEYKVIEKKGAVRHMEIALFDVYDFNPKDYGLSLVWMAIHMADVLEAHLILNNFEIEIKIFETLRAYAK